MSSRDAALEIQVLAQDPVPIRVRASGEWTFSGMKEHRLELARHLADLEKHPAERVAWDLSGVGELDDAGAVWLAHALGKATNIDVSPRHREILKQVSQGMLVPREEEPFDPLAGVVWTGTESITFRNVSPQALNEVYLRLWDNYHGTCPSVTPIVDSAVPAQTP